MNTYPIFRLALFLAAGIFFEEVFRLEAGIYPVAGMLGLLLFLGLLLRSSSYALRWLFGAGVSAFMFLLGWFLVEASWKDVSVKWDSDKRVYRGVVQEPVQEKARSYQYRLRVKDKDVLVYLPKDSLSASLQMADELLFYTRIDPPKNDEGFQDFDYATYLYHKGISGTAYVPAGHWKETGEKADMSLKQRTLSLRERLVAKYREWGIGEGQMAVLAALTLGDKGDMDRQVHEAYSAAGISHVLALSGMHVGIVWFLLNGMLGLLLRRRCRVLKSLVIVLALWGFAFLVGLEASVVRAVVMCMLVDIGRLSRVKALSMNTLAVAAFFMLLYNPFYLFDVGFQLSFVAVASILVLYPCFFGLVPTTNRLARWGWGVVCMSVSAQIGTAPLVMYYFSGFPVYFLLGNLVASVLVPLIIVSGFLMVLVSPFDGVMAWVVKLLDFLVSFLNGTAEWVSGLPYPVFSFPNLNPWEIVLSYVVLALGVVYWKTKRRVWLIRGLSALACLLALRLCLLCVG